MSILLMGRWAYSLLAGQVDELVHKLERKNLLMVREGYSWVRLLAEKLTNPKITSQTFVFACGYSMMSHFQLPLILLIINDFDFTSNLLECEVNCDVSSLVVGVLEV